MAFITKAKAEDLSFMVKAKAKDFCAVLKDRSRPRPRPRTNIPDDWYNSATFNVYCRFNVI